MELCDNNLNNVSLPSNCEHELLSCGICQGHCSRHNVLPCQHSFCQQCLYEYIPAESLSVTCPVCCQQSILPVNGLRALQGNFVIKSNMDAVGQQEVCSICESDCVTVCPPCSSMCDKTLEEMFIEQRNEEDNCQTQNQVDIPQTSLAIGSNDEPALVCTNHDINPLQFYCSSCAARVCRDCTLVEHKGHNIISLHKVVHEHKSTLASLVQDAKDQIQKIQEAINNITEVSQSLTKKTKIAAQDVTETFEDLVRLMNERKSVLLKDLNDIYNRKWEILQNQKSKLQAVLNDITSCCEVPDNVIENGTETETLFVEKDMLAKLQEFRTGTVRREPEENEHVSFNTSHFQGLKKSLGNIGYIQHNSAIAFNTTASGEGLKYAYVNKPAVITIKTNDCHGNLVKAGHAVIDSEMTATNGDRVIPALTDHLNGTYDLVYLVPREDNYTLFIKLFGRHIKSSPFNVKVVNIGVEDHSYIAGTGSRPRTTTVKEKAAKRPTSSWSDSNRKSNLIEDDLVQRVGEQGRNKGEFINPQGVCCTNDEILVADSGNQVAQVFTLSGEFKLRFGSAGRVPGKMQRPTGVAVTENGNFLVADYDNKWVSIFSHEGKYLNKIGPGKLLGPKGIAVDTHGRIIIVDNKASAIYIFQPNGKLVLKFGSQGNADHQLAGPHYAAVNANNDIIVSDFHNHCIKVFDCEGTYLYSLGAKGEGNGQFNGPTGVAVDEYGNILVADWGNSRIQVLDRNGLFLSYVNTSADPLYGPQGLAIDSHGRVVVSDSGNHCVKVYKYLH